MVFPPIVNLILPISPIVNLILDSAKTIGLPKELLFITKVFHKSTDVSELLSLFVIETWSIIPSLSLDRYSFNGTKIYLSKHLLLKFDQNYNYCIETHF